MTLTPVDILLMGAFHAPSVSEIAAAFAASHDPLRIAFRMLDRHASDLRLERQPDGSLLLDLDKIEGAK